MRAWQSARGPAGVTESLQYIIVFSLFVVLVSQHTAVPCPCLSLSEPLRVRDPSNGHGHSNSRTNMTTQDIRQLGFKMGMGKPLVFPKQVSRVVLPQLRPMFFEKIEF